MFESLIYVFLWGKHRIKQCDECSWFIHTGVPFAQVDQVTVPEANGNGVLIQIKKWFPQNW